jgi:hypothetical protein
MNVFRAFILSLVLAVSSFSVPEAHASDNNGGSSGVGGR